MYEKWIKEKVSTTSLGFSKKEIILLICFFELEVLIFYIDFFMRQFGVLTKKEGVKYNKEKKGVLTEGKKGNIIKSSERKMIKRKRIGGSNNKEEVIAKRNPPHTLFLVRSIFLFFSYNYNSFFNQFKNQFKKLFIRNFYSCFIYISPFYQKNLPYNFFIRQIFLFTYIVV
ncbi:MAG TPA: hypothetical protein P5150_01365 [Candidatus Ratteibacteria bacterium]|nr:hypothetical protein [Candidatus Ratteibacteria bacterium]